MPTPTVVAFDLGKVLVDFDYSIAARRLAADSNLSPAEMQRFLDHSPLLFRYETGLITRQDFFDSVREGTGYRGAPDAFAAVFADIFTEMPAMTALHAEIRQRGLPTYILSNTNDIAIEHIRQQFPFFAQFDGYVLSYEVGAMKPAPEIYAALEEMSGRRGPEILYLDDRHENVEAAAARGWQVVHQTDAGLSRAALVKAGVILGR
jgi:FMN phosphatase YigB (HAD superfamily)